MPDALIEIANRHGIGIEYWNFKPPLEAVYLVHPAMPPYIGISTSIRSNRAHLRCVLAEELGHHFTSVGNVIPSELYLYRDRLRTSQVEYRAMKWAAQHLLPRAKIKYAFQIGLHHPWEIAEYFDVTTDMVLFRMNLPDVRKLRELRIAI